MQLKYSVMPCSSGNGIGKHNVTTVLHVSQTQKHLHRFVPCTAAALIHGGIQKLAKY
jgi:hypothetical protein